MKKMLIVEISLLLCIIFNLHCEQSIEGEIEIIQKHRLDSDLLDVDFLPPGLMNDTVRNNLWNWDAYMDNSKLSEVELYMILELNDKVQPAIEQRMSAYVMVGGGVGVALISIGAWLSGYPIIGALGALTGSSMYVGGLYIKSLKSLSYSEIMPIVEEYNKHLH